MIRPFLCTLILLGAATALPAADAVDQDALPIRSVISEQLDAFAHDDAPRAFSLASSDIRAQFGTPEAFIKMVRSAYPVVFRPRTVRFAPPVLVEGEVVQPVSMTDAQGRSWIALYAMQRQPDGSWRINGCQLARATGVEV